MDMTKRLLFLLGMLTHLDVAITHEEYTTLSSSIGPGGDHVPTITMSSTQQTTNPRTGSTSDDVTGASSTTMIPSTGSTSGVATGVSSTTMTPTSSPGTSGPDQCFSDMCSAPTTGCLKDAIDNDTVMTCPRNDKYCRITRTTKDGQHTILADCVSDNCEFTKSNSEQQGEVIQNCCKTHHCNTEELLNGATTLLLPPPLFLSIVALLALVI